MLCKDCVFYHIRDSRCVIENMENLKCENFSYFEPREDLIVDDDLEYRESTAFLDMKEKFSFFTSLHFWTFIAKMNDMDNDEFYEDVIKDFMELENDAIAKSFNEYYKRYNEFSEKEKKEKSEEQREVFLEEMIEYAALKKFKDMVLIEAFLKKNEEKKPFLSLVKKK